MRKGRNPAKLDINNIVENMAFHQIIVPIHLPELNGYYKEGLDILKLCLESIYLTVHDKTFISVVNNGSCQEVRHYLDNCLNEKKIHEVIHTSAIGKINAIAKGLVGHNFDLVTITDADVLFTKGWQKAVYEIYETFPRAGMVGTTPNSKMVKHYTENVHFDNLLSSKIKFRPVLNQDDMLAFANSIDNTSFFRKIHLEKILTIKKNKIIAAVGSGHFTGTYRSSLLTQFKLEYSKDKISAKSDYAMLDNPCITHGLWRLCTYRNYTYHLGNVVEDWMYKKLKSINKEETNEINEPQPKNIKKSYPILLKVKQKFIRKLLFNNYSEKYYYRSLGLKKEEASTY